MAIDAADDDLNAPRRPRWRGVLLLLLVAFAGGAATMGYALTHWSVATRYLAKPAAAAPAAVQRIVTPVPVPALPADPIAAAAIDRRVADLEARLARIDQRATAASGDADRAEGLLVAFAARRAVERGAPLGYIEGLLRERFGATQPQAVSIVIQSARQPVTLDELEAGLSAAAPALASADPRESWLGAAQRQLASLVIIRRADTPPAPADRLARARLQLEAGHVAAALAEVARMPGRERAGPWIAQARRYATTRDALDVIETAALVDPRPNPPPTVAPEPAAPATGAGE